MINKNGDFSELAIEILDAHASLVEEISGDGRKGVYQSRYVIELKAGNYFCSKTYKEKPIPKELVGAWMMLFDEDLNREGWSQSIIDRNWCKCRKKVTTSYEWVRARRGKS